MTGPTPGALRVGLHVGQFLQRIPGGIGRYLGVLVRSLADEGVEVTPFAAGDPPDVLADTERYVDLGWPRGGLRYEAWHRLRRPPVRLDVDVIHAPSLAVPPTDGTPLAVTVHDLAFLSLPQYFTVRGLRFHERGLRLARESAASIVVPSHFVAGEMVGQGFEAARVHVAQHGIDPPGERDAGEVAAVVARHGLQGTFVLFVGTLEPRKGLETLVTGFRALRRTHGDVQLALVGPRGWGKLPRLDRPGVMTLGAISDSDLDALYRAATALAYPSEYEGFGLPALEAMVRGCPVVTSATTSLPEVVGDAGRLVDPHDADGLAEALAEVIDDAEIRETMAAAGRRQAGRFSWSASVRAHVDAYRAAIDAH